MPDFNNPLSTQGYLALLASIVENNQSALKLLDGVTSLTNLPTGAKRWNDTNKRFETWDGAAWAELATLFEMKVRNSDKLNGQAASYYLNAGNLNAGTLAGARFNDSSHGNRSGGSLHTAATTTVNGFMAAADKSKLNGIEAGATADQTGAEMLAALLSVDGAGSGLDADLLDGQHLSYVLGRANHTGTQPLSTISDAGTIAPKNITDLTTIATSGTEAIPAGGNYWYPAAGRYNFTGLYLSISGGSVTFEIYADGAWHPAGTKSSVDGQRFCIGGVICDGTNMRFKSGTNEALTVWWQKFNI